MKTLLLRSAAIASLTIGAAFATGVATPLWAAAAPQTTDITKLPLRKEILSALTDAQALEKKGDIAGAMEKAKLADQAQNKNLLEEYDVAITIGSYATKLNDAATASAAYNRVIESGAVQDKDKPGMLKAATQLDYVANNYAKAAEYGAQLAALGPLDDQTQAILVQSFFMNKDYPNAAKYAQAAIDAKRAAGQTPDPKVLEILVNSKVAQGDQAGAGVAVDMLADVSSSPQVWRMVTQQVLAGGNNLSDHQVINLLRLRLATGSMEETDYTTLAALDVTVGLPAEARDALKGGIAKGAISNSGRVAQLLTQTNSLAGPDEKSLPTLAKLADGAKNGEIDVKYGESLYTYGRNDEAIAALQKGIAKGGLKDPADAQLTLGVVYYTTGKKDEAAAAFAASKTAAVGGKAPVANIWAKWAARKV